MDKLREEFEAWYNKNIGKSTVFKTYDQSYLRRDTQEAWLAWQASSIPEGYVVVPKEMTDKQLSISYDFDECYTHQERKDVYKAMIEAVEKNDE